jgi:hypothetical protein
MKRVMLVDAISASALSATWYFGKLVAPMYVWDNQSAEGETDFEIGAAFQDGGQGTQNNSLGFLLLTALAKGWADDGNQLLIISLGTGRIDQARSYEKVERFNQAAQLAAYLKNQARGESVELQVRAAQLIENAKPENIHVFRFDYTAPRNASAFDAKLAKRYEEEGISMTKSEAFRELSKGLIALQQNKTVVQEKLQIIESTDTFEMPSELETLMRQMVGWD